MAPAQRLNDRAWPAIGEIKPTIAAIGVGLQDADKGLEMSLGMFARSIGRGVIERRGRILAAEWPIVANVSPDAAGFGLAFRQDRNRGVVPVQALPSYAGNWVTVRGRRRNGVGDRATRTSK